MTTDPALRAQPPVAHQLQYLRHIAEQALTAGRLPITDGGIADQQKYLSEVKDPRLIIALLDRLAAAEAAPLPKTEVVEDWRYISDEDRADDAAEAAPLDVGVMGNAVRQVRATSRLYHQHNLGAALVAAYLAALPSPDTETAE